MCQNSCQFSFVCVYPLLACLLLKGGVDYSRVQEYSLRVLRWQPRNVKALYRAGVATLELGDAQTAKEYLTQASREQPNGKVDFLQIQWGSIKT